MTTPPNPPADNLPPNPEPTPGQPAIPPDPADVEKNKVYAILAYVFILVLVPILAAPQSRFARYHANQGLILLIAGIAANFVIGCPLAVIGWIITFVTHGAFPVVCCAGPIFSLIYLVWLALAILGIISAANGQMKPLPVIGERFTLLK